MSKAECPIYTNFTSCELAENASTVTNIIKDKAKENSLTKRVGIERCL